MHASPCVKVQEDSHLLGSGQGEERMSGKAVVAPMRPACINRCQGQGHGHKAFPMPPSHGMHTPMFSPSPTLTSRTLLNPTAAIQVCLLDLDYLLPVQVRKLRAGSRQRGRAEQLGGTRVRSTAQGR